ncbi:protein phosphatase 2A regulatory subunit [Heterostelium album PN500]|uniref:Serine/threonine-protein phosphatase 2A 55 kDa regulatory subunit B n=1 Tax=Heterostelium pallidum (strain ATCC 26659 / Pp 5 / PN500) TaxID=670386 RepID=D3BJU2_HETP5|nr:protein phosphatase 2A regulatory subunit [Heterostelium album PN500]EFA78172.1 protein phosphatase 2A regulatory subunit [Heterostelium album PN500]|eukprot:XP_020430298.1 protein phosphatase 2A regulatory subunit [Heterostelium album PN500]
MSSEPLEWKFSQVFGNKGPSDDITDVDVVSAIEFDNTGDYIAAGDRGGRVVLFERSYDKQASQSGKKKDNKLPEYRFYSEFQSHEPEFDYLKSLEIEEKINKIKWCPKQNDAHFLLTTNDKTIKLWKVYEKKIKQIATSSPAPSNGINSYSSSIKLPTANNNHINSHNNNLNNNSIFKVEYNHLCCYWLIPRLQVRETVITAQPRKFECTINHDGTQMLTGSYNNFFHIYDRNSKQDVCLEASRQAIKPKSKTLTGKMKLRTSKKESKRPDDINPDTIDFTKKALHVSWHPKENLIAIGANNTIIKSTTTTTTTATATTTTAQQQAADQ